jgi:folate-binding protein YgfZ
MVHSSPLSAADAYTAARHHAAFLDRSERGRLVVSGKDRGSYLHGLLTNDIAVLKAGEGTYAAYLTPQGRMISDMWVYELGDAMLLALSRQALPGVLARLDQFVFTEDVQLGDVTATFAAVAVLGPEAAGVVSQAAAVEERELSALPEHGNLRTHVAGHAAIVTRITDLGVPGFEVYVEEPAKGALFAGLRSAGAVEADAATAEALRIEAGVPVFHRDMDEDTIPLEAGIESRAISMTKGCYVGQEVIVRVLHRGHGRVARRLVGLAIDGDTAPAPGSAVVSGGKSIGQVTSAAISPALNHPVALAYVQRDFVEPGTRLEINGVGPAEVRALPFVSPDASHPIPKRP